MAKGKFHISPLVRATMLFVGVTVTSAVLLGSSWQHQGTKPCKRIEIAIEGQADNFFLDLSAIRTLVDPDNRLTGAAQADIYLGGIERKLMRTLYVAKAVAYFTADGILKVNVTLRKPFARVLDNNGYSFFVDSTGFKIPLASQYSARTVLIRGSFTEHKSAAPVVTDSTLKELLPLAHYIAKDGFYKAQVSELIVNRYGEVTLVPQVGNTEVMLGRPVRYEEKLGTLLAFYRQVLNKSGWSYYRNINLKYAGQIVAVKANADTPATDTKKPG